MSEVPDRLPFRAALPIARALIISQIGETQLTRHELEAQWPAIATDRDLCAAVIVALAGAAAGAAKLNGG